MMLDRVFSYSDPKRQLPTDFGVLITQDNIEQHLQSIRNSHDRYARVNANDVEEIVRLVKETKRDREILKERYGKTRL